MLLKGLTGYIGTLPLPKKIIKYCGAHHGVFSGKGFGNITDVRGGGEGRREKRERFELLPPCFS